MNTKKYVGIAMVAFGISSCAGVSVQTDYDKKAQFSDLKTYSWASEEQPATGDARIDNTLVDSRIRQAVDSRLNAMGYQKITGGTPDFLMIYRLSIKGKLNVTTIDPVAPLPTSRQALNPSMAFDWYYGGQTFVSQYEEGTLLLDIVNPATQKLMWRGSAKGTVLEKASMEKREARINEAVTKILSKFPPK